MPRRQPSSGEPKKIPHPDAPNPWDPRPPLPLRGRLRHPSQRLSHRRNLRAVGASSGGPLSEEVVCRGVEPGGAVARSRWVQHAGAGGRRWSSKRGRLFFFFSTPPFPSLLPSTAASAGPAAKPGVGALRRDPPAGPQLAAVPPFILLLLLLLALSCAAEGLQLPWIRRRFRSSARLSRNSHLCAEETGHPEPPARLARHRHGVPAPPAPPDPAPGRTACLCLRQGKKPTQRINKWGKKSPFPPIRHPRLCRGHRRGVWHGAAAAALQGRPDTRWEGKVCAGGNRAGTRSQGPGRPRGRGRQGGRGSRREALAACPEPGLLGSCRNRVEREEDGELVSSRPGGGSGSLPGRARGAPREAAAAVPQFLPMVKWSGPAVAAQPGAPARWGPPGAPRHPAPGRR